MKFQSSSNDKFCDAATAIRRVTWFGIAGNVAMTALKLAVGFAGRSQTLVADGVHSLSDLATDAIVLIGARFWTRPADEDHPNGHAKIETLSTLFVGLVLFAVGLELIRSAVVQIDALVDGAATLESPSVAALVVAVVSIFVKEYLYRATISVGRKTGSAAVVANAWHHRSDALSSIPASLAIGGVLFLGPKFAFLDPVGAIIVSFMILYTAFEIVRPTISTLCDAGADAKIVEQIRDAVLADEAALDVHKIRTRPLGGSLFAVDLHVLVAPETTVRAAHQTSHRLARQINATLPQIVETTIHIEPFETDAIGEKIV